ncbi:hypothetical protein [Sinorhizobium meliloti]|uniref:hypothetical protein n=1 Tax=Rhizobium meliloti TaxID=382 RepID=UPI0020900A82|nr:hypothetical protein [Sinorhizobium meliloti]MCO5966566.1 hypothetical protein [Sinorhizobium meliloti]
MPSAPTVTLYTFTSAADLGDDRWKDPGLPSVFYEDREEARRSLLKARDELAPDPNSSFPLYLEKVETVPMTRSAIIALLDDGVEAIISNYEVIEEVARA